MPTHQTVDERISGGRPRSEDERFWRPDEDIRHGRGRPRGRRSPRRQRYERLATGLGWFSIALGAIELAAPGSIARLIGLKEDDQTRSLLQGLGAREIAHGLAILSSPESPGPVWTRVGGDAIDLAVLGSALTDDGVDRGRLAGAMAAVLGVAALDVLAAQQLSRFPGQAEEPAERTIHVGRTFTINRPPEEVYQFWRNFENLPRFMRHLESVQAIDSRRSHWRAKGPGGLTFQWDAEVTQDEPNEKIAWRTLDGADVQHSGSVRFDPAPGGRGTELRVHLHYAPPGGRAAAVIAKLFGREPGQQVQEDLRRLKQLLEAGEITRSDSTFGLLAPASPRAYTSAWRKEGRSR